MVELRLSAQACFEPLCKCFSVLPSAILPTGSLLHSAMRVGSTTSVLGGTRLLGSDVVVCRVQDIREV